MLPEIAATETPAMEVFQTVDEGEDASGVFHVTSYIHADKAPGVEKPVLDAATETDSRVNDWLVREEAAAEQRKARAFQEDPTAAVTEYFQRGTEEVEPEPVFEKFRAYEKARDADSKGRLKELFTSLDKVDTVVPSFGFFVPYLAEPDEERAKTANAYFLAEVYGKTVEEIHELHEFFRADYSSKTDDRLDWRNWVETEFYKTGQEVLRAEEDARAFKKSIVESAVASALGDDDDVASFMQWQQTARSMPGWNEPFARRYWNAYQHYHWQIRRRLRPHRRLVGQMVKAMRSQTGVEAEAAEYYHPEQELQALAEEDPQAYDLVLAALQVAASRTAPEDKRGFFGYLQRGAESLGRGTTNLVDGSIEFAGTAAARIADMAGAEDDARRIRAELQVGRDLRNLGQQVIDPVQSYSEGFMKDVDLATFGFLHSAPSMVTAMLPGGVTVLASSYTTDSYFEFRDAGFYGAGAEAAALFTGTLMAGVEKASEALRHFPGIRHAMWGLMPGRGARGGARFLLSGAGRGVTEFGEEFAQDMAAPVVQHILATVFDHVSAPQSLKEELSEWTRREKLLPLALMVLPLGLLGAGMSRRTDLPGVDRLTNDKFVLELAGLDQSTVAKLIDEPDGGKREAILQENWYQRGTLEERLARSEQVAVQWHEQQMQEQQGGGDVEEEGGGHDAELPVPEPAKIEREHPAEKKKPKGRFRGGAHGDMKLPWGDGLHSHHMPDRGADPDVSTDKGPAIQMEIPDHVLTSSHGRNGESGMLYRAQTADMIAEGRYRDAMAREIKDARNAALRHSGALKKYNEAISEMLDYARSSGQLTAKDSKR